MIFPDDFVDKLIVGDCLEIMKQIPDDTIDLIVTSPPYNKHATQKRRASPTASWKTYQIDYGYFKDDMPEQEYQEWQKKVLREAVRIIKPTGSICYNHKNRSVNNKLITPFEWLLEFNIRQVIIWDRGSTHILSNDRWYPTTEYIFWITKPNGKPKYFRRGKYLKEVWNISFQGEVKNLHPAPFPYAIPEQCILSLTEEGDIVLDPFNGSGTTTLAARNLNRHYIGIDINPEFVEMARARTQDGDLFMEVSNG
jgi:modification methylase